MTKILLIGLGGLVGAIARYGISGWVQRSAGASLFPYGTLTVNLIGCLLIGLFSGLIETRQLFSPEVRMLVTIGLLGSFTTYSTFSYESLQLLRDQQSAMALFSIGAHLIFGLITVWLGLILGRMIK